MVLTFLFLFFIYHAAGLKRIFESQSTPSQILATLQTLAFSYSDLEETSINSPEELAQFTQEVAFDYLYNESLSSVLEAVSEAEYVCMWTRSRDKSSDSDLQQYMSYFTDFVQTLNLTNVLLISDSEFYNLKITSYAIEKFPDIYTKVAVVPVTSDERFCNQFVGRMIKPRGTRFVAMFTDPKTTFNLLSAFEDYKMNRSEYSFVLSQESSLYRFESNPTVGLHASGTFVVAESTVEASSFLEFEIAKFTHAINCLNNSNEYTCNPAYNLYTIRDSKLILIPEHSKFIEQYAFHIDPFSKIQIKASVNYLAMEPDSSIISITLAGMRGFQIAFDEINTRSDLIPDYTMKNFSVNFTGITFDFNTTRERVLGNIDKIGVIHMPPPFSQDVIGTFEVFKSLNLTVPITGSCLGSSLSDKQLYPLYLRTRPRNEFALKIMCRTIVNFGWKKVAVLYENDKGDFEDSYNIFVQLAEMYRINITNSEKNRRTPAFMANSTSVDLSESLLEIIDSDTQVILIFSLFHYYILEQMYDLGVRNEYEIMLLTGLTDAFYRDPTYFKRRIVSKGALMFFQHLFVGEIGNKVRNELIRLDSDGYMANTCLYYDAAMLYFHATHFLLEQGRDYEDPYMIIDAMRKERFQGCSGLIHIESDSNDRSYAEIAISNFRYEIENDRYEIRVIGSYNPYVSEPVQFKKEDVQWPNGEASFSDFKPKYRYCSMLENKMRNNSIGRNSAIALYATFIVFSLGLSLVLRKHTNIGPVSMLASKSLIAIEDILLLLNAFLEFFSFASLGPFITRLYSAIGFSFLIFDRMLNSESEIYWIQLNSILSIIAFWVALISAKRHTHVSESCFSPLISINDFLSVFIGNALFIPFTAVLMQVFMCSKGTSDDFKDTFMDKDCNVSCWSGVHLVYSIVSGIVLISYVVNCLIYKLYVENHRNHLHIQTNLSAIVVKLPFEMGLVVAFVTAREEIPDIHAYIYIGLMTIYSAIMTVMHEYNYARLNLWVFLLQIDIIVLAIGALLSTKLSEVYSKWILLILTLLYIGSAIVGIVVQSIVPRFASKLKRQQSINVKFLLEFAFTLGTRAQTALRNHYTFNSNRNESDQPFTLYI